jgi:hypothetical protein
MLRRRVRGSVFGSPPKTFLAVLGAIFVALVIAASAYAYVQVKYVDTANVCAHCEKLTPSAASRQWNKVYRPIGIHFCLQYLSGSCVFNTFDNPFIDNRSTFNDYAGCWDDDTVASYPTTCITTHP